MTLVSDRDIAAAPEPRAREVLLLSVDEDLHDAIPPADRPFAERSIRAAAFDLPAGPWHPHDLGGVAPSSIVLVLSGLVTSEIGLAESTSAQLHGPGELLMPWDDPGRALPAALHWTVSPGGASVAVLGESFRRAQVRWPQLAVCLQRRFAEQAGALAMRTAIVSLPRVEQRVLALFWQLAERWGTVRPDGVTVHLRLTHELIGRLAAAKRPTVSLALAELAAQGALRPDEEHGWRLSHESAALLRGWRAPVPVTSLPVALR